jgi:hypothetical protein
MVSWIAKAVEKYAFTAEDIELLLNKESDIKIGNVKIDKRESDYFIRLSYTDKEILNTN